MKTEIKMKINGLIQKIENMSLSKEVKATLMGSLVYIEKDIDQLMDRSEYIATKVWAVEDIEDVLLQEGYIPSARKVEAVINTGLLQSLNDCTDQDWQIITSAIHAVRSDLEEMEGNAFFEIYQLECTPDNKEIKFLSYKELVERGFAFDLGRYKKMYTQKCDSDVNLEKIYLDFNLHIPEDYKGHSLSVSDVVVVYDNERVTYHYVDTFGFTEVEVNRNN